MPRLLRSLLPALLLVGVRVLAADVRIETDVAYLETGRSEKLDLYLPPAAVAAGKPAPALVWIHGGGWTGGTKNENRAKEIGTTLAAAGYVVASIDYRLGNGAWPQNLHDCKNAVRFLRAHAAKYGIDPRRIAVGGGSAGGHLALMVAYTAGQTDLEPTAPYPGIGSEVACVLNFYGITNILTRRATDPKGVPLGTAKLGGAGAVFGTGNLEDPVLKLGSPVTHVRPGVPPTLILHGKADATVDYLQAEELAAVLARHGVPHELHLIDGVGHTFALQNWGKKKMSRDLTPVVLDFLARHGR